MKTHILPLSALALSLAASSALAQVEVVFASTSHSPGPKTAVPNMPGQTFKNFTFPYRSPTNSRWVCVCTTNSGVGTADQCLVIGQGLSGTTVALEGTYPDASGSTFGFGVLTNPAINDNGDWVANVTFGTLITSGEKIIGGSLSPLALPTIPSPPVLVAAESTAIPGIPGATFNDNAFNSPNTTTAGPTFMATVLGTAYPEAGFINNVPVVRVGVDIPTGQRGGTTETWGDIDRDFFQTDGTGTHWLVKGTLSNLGSRVVAVDGAVVAQVGFPLTGMTSPVSAIADASMDPAGAWHARGSNADGVSWALRNGIVVARSGEPIYSGSSENWVTIQDIKSNAHGDYVVLGTTSNASTLVNQVLVTNGRAVIVRKSDGVDLDGDRVNETNLFIHTISAGRMIPNDDGYLYFSTQMKLNPTDTTGISGNNNSLVRLPMCPADLGQQGGIPGVDGILDNNDFVVLIDSFFVQHPRADLGQQGGLIGRDGLFDNNDFVAFIDLFFTACR